MTRAVVAPVECGNSSSTVPAKSRSRDSAARSASLERSCTVGYNRSSRSRSRSRSPSPASSTAAGEGEQKPVLAKRYKTKLCKNFVQCGSCPYDIRCMFAHGDKELRTAEMNVKDGLVTKEAISEFQRLWRRSVLISSALRPRVPDAMSCKGPGATATAAACSFAGSTPCCHRAPPRPAVAAGDLRLRTAPVRICGRYVHSPYRPDILPIVSRHYSALPDVFVSVCSSVRCSDQPPAHVGADECTHEGKRKEEAETRAAGAEKRGGLEEACDGDHNGAAGGDESGDDVDGSTCSSVGNESGDFCHASRSASCGEQGKFHAKREGNEGRSSGLRTPLTL